MTTYSYVNDYGKVKIDATNPNKVTPKLQKSLILDMPLKEPYTKAKQLVSNYDFSDGSTNWAVNAGCSISGGQAIINNTNDYEGIFQEVTKTFEVGKTYEVVIDVESITSGQLSYFISGSGVQPYQCDNDISIGINKFTYTNNAVVNQYVKLRGYPTVDAVVNSFSVKELDVTVQDKTPNRNNGEVNGATLTHDGLVNTSDGLAYIPLTRQNTYQFRAKHQNTGATYMFASQNITGTEGYGLRLHTDGKLQLFEDTGQIAETAASYLVDNTDYQFKVTWSQVGVFTVYIKGGSYGWDSWTTAITHTDTTYDDAFYFVANTTADCEVSDLQVL
jgi:hypothetical protein